MCLPRIVGHVGRQVRPFPVQFAVHKGQFAIKQHVEIHRLLVICALDSLMEKREKLTLCPGDMDFPQLPTLKESYTLLWGSHSLVIGRPGAEREEKRHWQFGTREKA